MSAVGVDLLSRGVVVGVSREALHVQSLLLARAVQTISPVQKS